MVVENRRNHNPSIATQTKRGGLFLVCLITGVLAIAYGTFSGLTRYQTAQQLLAAQTTPYLTTLTDHITAAKNNITMHLDKLVTSKPSPLATTKNGMTVSYWENNFAAPYSNTIWFTAGAFLQKEACFWSFYSTPQPMIRCTTPHRSNTGVLTGVITIDSPLTPLTDNTINNNPVYLSTYEGSVFSWQQGTLQQLDKPLAPLFARTHTALMAQASAWHTTQRTLYGSQFDAIMTTFTAKGIAENVAARVADQLLLPAGSPLAKPRTTEKFTFQSISEATITNAYYIPALGWLITYQLIPLADFWSHLGYVTLAIFVLLLCVYGYIIRYFNHHVFGPLSRINKEMAAGTMPPHDDTHLMSPTLAFYDQKLNRYRLASHRKSRFLANVSHEIRTPLNGIMGLSQLLSQSRLSSQQKQYVGAIIRSGKALLQIVNDILDLSRIEADRMVITKEPFNLQTVIKDIYDLMQAQAAQKGLLFTYKIPHGFPLILEGDALRFRQVITNLVGNALKFTERGFVEIVVDSYDVTDTLCHFTLTVADSGIGISEELQKTLFETYVRGESDHRKHIEGTGLGLALCKNLVELMGGYIHLDSQLHNGSKFTIDISLPLSDNLAAEVQVSDEAVTPANAVMVPKDILVVEDSQVNMMFAEALLRKWGHHVYKAENGKEAIQILADHPVDLVFMDVQMPEMDGIEATSFIRSKLVQNRDVPIVALTANATAGEDTICFEAGMNDYLSKPFAEDQMASLLYKWTQKNPTEDSQPAN